jgi:hypothetical protein
MKKLDFILIGVQELDALEMKETDGGLYWLFELACAYIIVEACCNPTAHINAFREGWAMAE